MSSFPQSANFARACTSAMLVLLAFAPWAGVVQAQSVFLDGQTTAAFALTTSSTQSAVSIDATTGNVRVRSLSGGIQCTAVAAPTITNFSPTSSSVLPGSNITLNWTSTNTTSCTPAQGPGTTWASQGTLNPSGSLTFLAPSTSSATPITFQLNCTNGSATVSQTTQVTVQDTNPGTCTPIYPNAQTASFNGVFGAWPAFNTNRRVFVPADGYVSYQFVATSVANQFGSFTSTDFPNDGGGHGQMSISRVSGCFTPSELAPGCLGSVSRFTSVSWRNGAGDAFRCGLTAGQTYYINFTYGNATTAAFPARPYCPLGSGSCGADIGNIVQD
jgi:hypothetical protein